MKNQEISKKSFICGFTSLYIGSELSYVLSIISVLLKHNKVIKFEQDSLLPACGWYCFLLVRLSLCVSSWQSMVMETPSAAATSPEAGFSTLPGVYVYVSPSVDRLLSTCHKCKMQSGSWVWQQGRQMMVFILVCKGLDGLRRWPLCIAIFLLAFLLAVYIWAPVRLLSSSARLISAFCSPVISCLLLRWWFEGWKY